MLGKVSMVETMDLKSREKRLVDQNDTSVEQRVEDEQVVLMGDGAMIFQALGLVEIWEMRRELPEKCIVWQEPSCRVRC
jgi:hypothetical protein